MGDYEPVCPECKDNRNVVLAFAEGMYVCKKCRKAVQLYVVSEVSEWRYCR